MHIAVTKPLFAWECLEDSPSLGTIRRFLRLVPDGKLLDSLSRARGRGRDDYPVTVCWGVVLLTILLRHPSIEACLAELRRNEALRGLIGIRSEAGVPRDYNMSRFLTVLGSEPHRSLLRGVFEEMARRLGAAVPDLGQESAGDSTGLSARPGVGEETDGLPWPSGGRKEYTNEAGKVTKAVEWLGYKLHLLVDKRHEVAVAYEVTAPSVGDAAMIPALLDGAARVLPKGRIRTLAYDKAADDEKTHAELRERKIKPVIEMRALWTEELERKLPGHDGRSNVVYDEAGTVYCYDTVSDPPVRHAMSYAGHEPGRGTLKYRCPAMAQGGRASAQGWDCPMSGRCNEGKRYGKTVRVKQEIDLRRFPPIPRATKQFERLYQGRTSVERVNARLKVFWGADDGNITGPQRFHAFVGAVLVVHLGLATLLASTPRKEGPLGQMRLSPIARALQHAAAAPSGG
jgi:hypothetical protein